MTSDASCLRRAVTALFVTWAAVVSSPSFAQDFKTIPPGSFQMGDTLDLNDRWPILDAPARQVTLSTFHIQSTEVTKAQWDETYTWALAHGYTFYGTGTGEVGLGKAPAHPVYRVNWHDALKWCNARSEKEGLIPCYYTGSAKTIVYRSGYIALTNDCVMWASNGYRLPTEAEWEKAARGGQTGRRFPAGDTISHTQANYLVSGIEPRIHYDVSETVGYHPAYNDYATTGVLLFTSPVASFAPNAYGLYDLDGNVKEWCWDAYQSDYYSTAPASDPKGPEGYDRVCRSGSWANLAAESRLAQRVGVPFSGRYNNVGFRLARSTLATGDSFTAHRCLPSALANAVASSPASAPLEPKPVLGEVIESSVFTADGLVADGVTPLLFKISGPRAIPATYRISPSITGGGSIPDFASRFKVLQPGAWVAAGADGLAFTTAGQFTGDPYQFGFSYLSAIDSDDIALDPGSKEITCRLLAEEISGNVPTGRQLTLDFKIRKPPVILIHGYNTKGNWDETFLDQVRKTRPDDWVRVVKYGVEADGSSEINTYGSLPSLAALLHSELLNIPFETDSFRNGWALTRYDVIGHSQGGVLARMLCSAQANGSVPPFRSASNGFRGRFHRVVTIGSPHNGTRIARYNLGLLTLSNLLRIPYREVIPSVLFYTWTPLQGTLQPKFDPFGPQIIDLNKSGSRWKADPAARFKFITTAASGQPAFLTCGLYGSRLSAVLPFGSDGVTDWKSARASGSDSIDITSHAIAHATPILFGALDGHTDSPTVAVACMSALNGQSPCIPFPSLDGLLLTPQDKQRIDAAAGADFKVVDALVESLSGSSPITRSPRGPASTIRLHAIESPGEPIASAVNWWVEVYGAGGATAGGVTITPDAVDSTRATVNVPADTEGEVVVYANYLSTTGKIVFGRAFKVASIAPAAAMTGIELRNLPASAIAGSVLLPDLWATYADGIKRQLFPAGGEVAFQSSAPAVVEIGTDGTPLAKAAGIANLQGAYKGFTATVAVAVTAAPAPVILRQPQDLSVASGARVLLDVTVDGGGQQLAYQWRRNRADLPGATTETLVIESAGEDDVGTYAVRVTGPGGEVVSADAAVTVGGAFRIGPDAAGYTAMHRSGPAMQDISATGTAILRHADDAALAVPLGFSFPFYGVRHTSVFVSSNGLLAFGSADTAYQNADLAAAVTDRPLIAVLWDDWYTDKTGLDGVFHATTGTPGNRFFTVQWIVHRATAPGTQGAAVFQCRLSEASGEIAMFFPDLDTGTPAADRALGATVGIADQGAPAAGRFLQWAFNRDSLADGDILSFLPAGAVSGHAATWRLQHFGSSAATGQGSDGADPDHDGIDNLIERALGSDPMLSGPVPWSIEQEAGTWKFRYNRSAAARAAGTTYAVECGPTLDPAAWSAAGVTESFTTADGIEHVTAILPPHAASKRFARLRVGEP